jgi:DNA-binding Lrp family transcriptional regulator
VISDGLDDVDLSILHALHVDGRVAFATLAEILGVSDQTVARRYARLRSTHGVRVVGRTDPMRVGETSWFVRIRCVPSAVAKVGGALARRDDTSWVKVTSGGTELVAVVRAPSHADTRALLLEQLPRTPQVLDVAANFLLHQFFGGTRGVVNALSTDQVRSIEPEPVSTEGVVDLSADDRTLLRLLAADGRTDVSALSAESGVPATTVRRRLAALRASGALYFDVDVDYALLGGTHQTLLWLTVAPADLVAAGEMLAAHPEIAFAAATTGATNLFANVVCADPAALFAYLTTGVAALPSVQSIETAPVIRTLKQL